jgi:hypothetical protein
MNDTAPTRSPKAAELKSVLLILDQVEAKGPSSERMKVAELPFWRATKVSRLARTLDRIFVNLKRAEPVSDAEWRLEVALETARREGRDMQWLGERIGGIYRMI